MNALSKTARGRNRGRFETGSGSGVRGRFRATQFRFTRFSRISRPDPVPTSVRPGAASGGQADAGIPAAEGKTRGINRSVAKNGGSGCQ